MGTPGIDFVDFDAILDSANTISKARLANINSAVFQEILETSDFTREHSIETGVENGDMVPILEKTKQWGFLKKTDTTVGCNYNECSIVDKITNKFWDPKRYDCEIPICLNDPVFTRDFRAFWNINCSKYDNDLDNTFTAYLINRAKEAQNDAMWRIAYFDFKANADTDYAGIDGFFIQWQAIATPANTEQRVVITENSSSTIAGQLNLPADAAYNYFKSMYDKMLMYQTQMLGKAGLKFEVTRELAANYLQYLQNTREVSCCYNMTHDGATSSGYALDRLNYMGIPIIIRDEWTEIIKWQAGETPTVYDKPHRAVLTYDGNKPLGTCDQNKLKEFKTIFDPVKEKLHIRVKSTFDAKVPLDKDFILAI